MLFRIRASLNSGHGSLGLKKRNREQCSLQEKKGTMNMEELFYFKQSKFLVAVPIFGSMHYMFWFLLLIKHLIYTLMLDPGFQKVELIGSIKSDEIFKASCLENIS